MAFFAEAQAGGLSPREAYGRAALRAASALGNKAIFDQMIKDGEEVFGGRRTDLAPDDLLTMAEATAANAVSGTLHLDPDWVNSHVNPWAPEPATHEPQTSRVRVSPSTMGLGQRLSGRAPSR